MALAGPCAVRECVQHNGRLPRKKGAWMAGRDAAKLLATVKFPAVSIAEARRRTDGWRSVFQTYELCHVWGEMG